MLDILIAISIALNSPEQNTTPKERIEPTYTISRIDSSTPYINAKSGLIIDINSNTVLYEQNINEKLPIASLTKLMTAQVILEENPNLQEVVTVHPDATQIGGSSAYLYSNEQITIESLLNALLIKSGNDAAIALAIHNAGSVDAFVNKMNQKAISMGLNDTHFQNPMGFDHSQNYSTSHDLAKLALSLYKKPIVKEIVRKQSETIYSIDGKYTHNLISTNDLLDNYLGIIGLKTGQTSNALGCFIGITNSNNPHLSIVLGSNNRFLDTKILLDWAKNNFTYESNNL